MSRAVISASGGAPPDWGIGRDFPFRGIGFPKKTPDEIIKTMSAYKIAGINFVKRPGKARDGKMITGVYVEVTNWDAWNPTELSFYMHRQAAAWQTLNPFAALTTTELRSFNIHVGSTAWSTALRREGARRLPGDLLGLLFGCLLHQPIRTLEQPVYTAPYGGWPL